MCIIWVGKIVLIVLFLIIGCVSFFGTLAGWRDVHNYAHDSKNEKWIDKNDEKMYTITPWRGVFFNDDTNNGKISFTMFAACNKDFEKDDSGVGLPEDSGFYGDAVVISLLSIAFLVCIFNIIWTIISFFACCCDTCFLNLLPGTTFFVTVLLITSTIIFAVDVDQYYGRFPVDVNRNAVDGSAVQKLYNDNKDKRPLVDDTDDMWKGDANNMKYTDGTCVYRNIDGQFPLHISYGAGFYLTILCIILNVGAFILSLFVSFLRKIFCA